MSQARNVERGCETESLSPRLTLEEGPILVVIRSCRQKLSGFFKEAVEAECSDERGS